MSVPVVVTGIGIISSIGTDFEETKLSLLNKKTGITPVSILNTRHKDFVLGEVKKTQAGLHHLAGTNPDEAWTRTALLAIIAASEAVANAALDHNDSYKTGIVSASTVGGMDKSEQYYKDFIAEAKHKKYIDTHHAGNHTEKIAEKLGITDYLTTISTACSSSLNSIMSGVRLIKNGLLDRVVVGGADALSKFTLNGFNTLMILDKEHCRPFDESRRGLNLGEGAAYLVLEREDLALEQGKKIYAYVSGYANANDAHHQTASSGDGKGPYLAMKQALGKTGLQPSDIDYINVHGTGTENNDLTESIALKRLFGDQLPPFSSTKAFTGHTLGAAGVIESIFSIIALQEQKLLPNINFKKKIRETGLVPVTDIQSATIEHVLTNSFGFGGNDSSLIFSSHHKNLAK